MMQLISSDTLRNTIDNKGPINTIIHDRTHTGNRAYYANRRLLSRNTKIKIYRLDYGAPVDFLNTV